MNFFTIIIDTCNHEKWIRRCVESCLNQNYKNFEIIILDALSTDTTFKICKEFENKNKKIKAHQNEKRLPQVANFINLAKLSKDKSILVSVDGDDWLKDEDVLTKLDKTYSLDEVWMTYGTYEEFPYRNVSDYYFEYPKTILENNDFRNYRWLASHLRTFRKELIFKIKIEDLKDDNNEWLTTTGDQAIMLPMLEMSSERSKYVSDILYVYNVSDNSRDSYINEKKQIELANYIRKKPKYNRLEKL
jgi:glycosyltransferase involved in cell wall biosynthesis